MVVVTASDDARIARLPARGMSESDVRARMAAQMPLEDKAAHADVVLDNDGTEARPRGARSTGSGPTCASGPYHRRREVPGRAVRRGGDAGAPGAVVPRAVRAASCARPGTSATPTRCVEASAAVRRRFSEAARDGRPVDAHARVVPRVLARRVRAACSTRSICRRPTGCARRSTKGSPISATTRCSTTCPQALDELARRGVTLGIVSNFEAWLEDLLAALGVRERFPVRVISGIEGIEKPDRRIYGLALERARRRRPARRPSSATTPSSTSTRPRPSACSRC